jgi:Fur family zinc uptake transcriptional regulator
MPRNSRPRQSLTTRELLVEGALRKAGRPLSAYDLIELLHNDGVSSPPTVYRVLKRLTEAGLAHRVESLNAFVSCAHAGHSVQAAFAICRDCGAVSEFHDGDIARHVQRWADDNKFRIGKSTIELLGQCSACQASPTRDKP